MRIRSIKPEFWRSPDISCLAIEDRLLFIGLWSYVDDNGVGEDRVSMVAADLFADDLERDPSDTFARVSRGLANLSAAGRIIRYTVDGRDYVEIANWSKHQRIDRPGKERMPKSDHESAHIREGVAKVRETPLTGTGDQGTGDQGTGSREVAARDPARKRATRIPDDFEPSPAVRADMAAKRPDVDLELETEKFRDFWAAKPGKDGTKLDWDATWRNWIRNSRQSPQSQQKPRAGNGYDPADWLRKPDEPSLDFIDAEVVQLREIGR